MPKRKGRPSRRFPQRSCVACRKQESKRRLIRVVRSPEGDVEVDPSGRRPGRGAYLCPNPACWQKALKGRTMNRALRTVLTSEEVGRLRAYAQSLPDEEMTT